MTASRARSHSRFVQLAVTDDEATARAWVAALDAADIPVELRIEDARRLGNTSTMFPFGPVFATALYVKSDHRVDAAAVLIDLGWDGRRLAGGLRTTSIPTRAILGSVVAVALSGLALVASLIMRGG